MDKKEIDELFDSFNNKDIAKFYKFADTDIEKLTDEEKNMLIDNRDEPYRKIMKKIEEGDYEYFLSLKRDPSKESLFNILFDYLSDERAKELIEDKEKLEELDIKEFGVVAIINSIEDLDYKKHLVEDRKKIENLELGESALISIIEQFNDADYIKDILANEDRLENLRLDGFWLVELIKAVKDKDYIKGIVEDENMLNRLRLTGFNLINLIKLLDDEEYIKCILEDRNKIDTLRIDSYYLIEFGSSYIYKLLLYREYLTCFHCYFFDHYCFYF